MIQADWFVDKGNFLIVEFRPNDACRYTLVIADLGIKEVSSKTRLDLKRHIIGKEFMNHILFRPIS